MFRTHSRQLRRLEPRVSAPLPLPNFFVHPRRAPSFARLFDLSPWKEKGNGYCATLFQALSQWGRSKSGWATSGIRDERDTTKKSRGRETYHFSLPEPARRSLGTITSRFSGKDPARGGTRTRHERAAEIEPSRSSAFRSSPPTEQQAKQPTR